MNNTKDQNRHKDNNIEELYYLEEDYKDWKLGEEVYVIEKYWLHRDFGVGTILGFEINKPYNSYRIKIELKHPWFKYETFFLPYDVFKRTKPLGNQNIR